MFRSLWLRQIQRRLVGFRPFAGPQRRNPQLRQVRRSVRLQLESLEDRVTPSTVINVNDPSGGMDNPANVTVATLGSNITLRDAINAADNTGGSGSYVINLPAGRTITFKSPVNNDTIISNNTVQNQNWYGPNALPAITSNITIQGNGDTLAVSGTNMRFFYVSGGPTLTGGALSAGNLELDNLTLTGGVAQGGSGSNGGGGLGAGGAIFNQGTLTLNSDTLTNNRAIGGSGNASGSFGGGGGGMGGNATSSGSGGFGGGFSIPNGPTGGSATGGGGGGAGFRATDNGGNATGNPNGSGGNGGAGGGLGGFGGAGGSTGIGTGGPAGDGGGGGGGYSNGGEGGSFGGGGVSSTSGGGGGGGIGGGGAFGDGGGGGGGFGGGGGGLDGAGGFGGGGGSENGGGGFGGGVGGSGPGGGGGAGLGGGIFSMFGSLTVLNSTLSGNIAQGGNGSPRSGAVGGSGYGGAIFNLDGTTTFIYATIANNSVSPGTGSGGSGNANAGGVYNLAYGNTLTGGANTATLTLDNSVIGQNQNNGGHDLVNDAENGRNTNTAQINGSSSAVQGTVLQTGNGTNTIAPGTITVTAPPNLATSLANNGGLTPTLAPNSGSPLIGAGSAAINGLPTVDQRGLGRPSSSSSVRPDISALQTQSTTTTITNVTTPYNSGGQTITLTANVDAFGDPTQPASEGQVTFTLAGTGLGPVTAPVVNGVATTTINLPPTLNSGKYTINASYTDPNIPALYDPSSGSGTLTINTANSSLTVTTTNNPLSYNSGSETLDLQANVTSSNGGTVNEGDVVFTVNGVSSAPIAVSRGTATDVLTLPSASVLAAGNYPSGVSASYTDTLTSNYASANATGDVVVDTADTETTLVSTTVTSTFNSTTPQTVTLTASVTSIFGGIVNEGNVTFTVPNLSGAPLTATGAVVNGTATATLTIPANFPAGTYSFSAAYADILNSNGTVNYLPSTAPTTGTLVVNPANTTTTVTAVNSTYSNAPQTVTLTATVTSNNGGIVNEGNVTFIVANPIGANLTATGAVVNGTATANITIPAGFPVGTYLLSAAYADILNINEVYNYLPSRSVPTTLTEDPLPSSVSSVSNVTLPYTNVDPATTLSATVTTREGPVNVGQVRFVVTNSSGSQVGRTVTANVSNGQVSTVFDVPDDTPVGAYTITATYSDPAGNLTSSSGTGTLNVVTSPTRVTVNNVSIVYGMFGEQETLTAVVFNALGQVVNQGFVTFSDSGQTVTVPIVNSLATATLNIPVFAENPFAHSITAAYSSNNGNFFASTIQFTIEQTLMDYFLQIMALELFLQSSAANPPR
jgi:hypothetical protein